MKYQCEENSKVIRFHNKTYSCYLTLNASINIDKSSVENEVYRIFAYWISIDIKRAKKQNSKIFFDELSLVIETILKDRYFDESLFFTIFKK